MEKGHLFKKTDNTELILNIKYQLSNIKLQQKYNISNEWFMVSEDLHPRTLATDSSSSLAVQWSPLIYVSLLNAIRCLPGYAFLRFFPGVIYSLSCDSFKLKLYCSIASTFIVQFTVVWFSTRLYICVLGIHWIFCCSPAVNLQVSNP